MIVDISWKISLLRVAGFSSKERAKAIGFSDMRKELLEISDFVDKYEKPQSLFLGRPLPYRGYCRFRLCQ